MSTAMRHPSASVEALASAKSGTSEQFITRLLNTDFCPQFNRYLYWLKEPIGWFALAATASLLVGAFLSPIGWTLAAGLISMMIAGLALPWISVRFAECKLEPVVGAINEHETSQLLLTVRNRLPLPLWGLMIEGYLATPLNQTGLIGDASLDFDKKPDVGLACVPPLCEATFRLSIRPEYRGVYPVEVPQLACGFPFGIWTARRKVSAVTPVTVWPMRVDLSGLLDIGGAQNADEGVGERVGTSGDFLGVRAFRRGDSLRSIHWVQTARLDSLVVCDRSGPQQQTVTLELETRRIDGNALWAREHLAWRVRVAASLAELLCARHIPFKLLIDHEMHKLAAGKRGLEQALDLLAAIPLDHHCEREATMESTPCHVTTRIAVGLPHLGHGLTQARCVGISLTQATHGFRSQNRQHRTNLELNGELIAQLNHFLSETSHACFAA